MQCIFDPMNKTKLAYIKKLIEWKSTQKMALLGEECVRDLIAMDAARANELPAADAQVAKRIAYIAEIENQIASAKRALAA
jgi:hypothetical protein